MLAGGLLTKAETDSPADTTMTGKRSCSQFVGCSTDVASVQLEHWPFGLDRQTHTVSKGFFGMAALRQMGLLVQTTEKLATQLHTFYRDASTDVRPRAARSSTWRCQEKYWQFWPIACSIILLEMYIYIYITYIYIYIYTIIIYMYIHTYI